MRKPSSTRLPQRRVTAVALGVALSVVLVSSSCLAPNQFDPTGAAPIGHLDVVVDAAGGIRVAGWALDPESSASLAVKVGVGGVVRQTLANRERPDVAMAYPGKGSRHGFEYTFGPLAPGVRGICVWVENQIGGGEDRLLGCDNILVTDGSPIGAVETVASPAPRSITVSGWTFDPSTSAPAEVAVTVDAQSAARLTADGARPDVGRVHGRSRSGFATTVSATPGRHQVCVGVFNVGFGADRLLGCRYVTVAESTADRRPTGHLTLVRPTDSDSVLVEGVAEDPDGPTGLQVRLEVDPDVPGAPSVVLDVVHGRFSVVLDGLAPGLHTLCPVGLDVDGGIGVSGDRSFICGSTVLGDVAVGTGGAASNPTWVAPPVGSPLRTASRDAGVSVELRDGSVMWFFGDTLDQDRVGNLEYLVNNTAAWAAEGEPTVTLDAVKASGVPWKFADAGDFCAPSPYDNAALWPESAVAVPQADGTDRVLVFMSKVCLGDTPMEIDGRGIALVATSYDPDSPPNGTRIHGTVIEPSLFGIDHPYGRAALLSDAGDRIYAYECGLFDPGDWDAPRPCTVGRVPVTQVADSGAWRFWNGADWSESSSWVTDAAQAAAIESTGGADVLSPVAGFTLTRDAAHDAYVMVYSPWPGFTDRVEVRVALTPVGPFTDPVTVMLPGCDDETDGVRYFCYAGTAQPSLSSPGLLGLGYYDQLITPSPKRGQYVAVTVPFTVVLTAGP